MPRKAAEAYAAANGYFWLPCPVCGELFGGHEYGKGCIPYPLGDPRITQVTCNKPECEEYAYTHYPELH